MGTQIVIKDASKLEGVRNAEFEVSKHHIQLLAAVGATLVLTTGGMDEMAQKYLAEAGILGVRRVSMEDLRRVAKLTGATVVTSMADMEGGESFDPANLGHAKAAWEERIGEDRYIIIEGGAGRPAGSILLRGPNPQIIGEVERSVHDALCAVSRALECGAVVPGGGCVEAALSTYLEEYAKTIESKEQLAVNAFAKALLAIPRQLALNSALDAIDLVSQLRAAHAEAQKKDTSADRKKQLRYIGLDLMAGGIRDNLQAGVLEPAMSKIRSLSFATEAAITILRIDDLVSLNPETQPEH